MYHMWISSHGRRKHFHVSMAVSTYSTISLAVLVPTASSWDRKPSPRAIGELAPRNGARTVVRAWGNDVSPAGCACGSYASRPPTADLTRLQALLPSLSTHRGQLTLRSDCAHGHGTAFNLSRAHYSTTIPPPLSPTASLPLLRQR